MSSHDIPQIPGFGGPASYGTDPKQVQLVEVIVQKTKEKKIYWNKVKVGGYVAVVGQVPPNQTFLKFEPSSSGTWQTFTVTTSEGLVLKVENTPLAGLVAKLAGITSSPLVDKTTELYAIVSEVGEGSVERALNSLKKL